MATWAAMQGVAAARARVHWPRTAAKPDPFQKALSDFACATNGGTSGPQLRCRSVWMQCMHGAPVACQPVRMLELDDLLLDLPPHGDGCLRALTRGPRLSSVSRAYRWTPVVPLQAGQSLQPE